MCHVHGTHSNHQAAPITVHRSIYYKSHTDKFMAVLLHTRDDKKVKYLYYSILHSPVMSQ